MLRRTKLLATIAAALAALAAPAAAQAEQVGFTMEGVPIEETGTMALVGQVEISTSSGSIACTGHRYRHFTVGILGFFHETEQITESSCELGGALALICSRVGEATVGYPGEESFPGHAEDNGGTRSMLTEGVRDTYSLEGGALCPSGLTVEGNVTSIPDNYEAISAVALSGELESNGFGTATETGTLEVTEAPGTYGIE